MYAIFWTVTITNLAGCLLPKETNHNLGGIRSTDGKDPSLFGFGSVRVLVKFVKRGFRFGSVLPKMRVLVQFVRFGFGSIPISKNNVTDGETDLLHYV